jgi:hypothetical protein
MDVAEAAKKTQLDYIILTDHNNYSQNDEIPAVSGITVIPGMEWTNYRGHSGFWGIRKAIENPFSVKNDDDMADLLRSARENGAVVTLNHPQCPYCGWHFDMDKTEYDLLEVWNGGVESENNRLVPTIEWWHRLLTEGKRKLICGGSDFHSPSPMKAVGMPCTVAYAFSDAPEDILSALKEGRSYIAAGRSAPGICINIYEGNTVLSEEELSDGCVLGQTLPKGTAVRVTLAAVRAGDEVRFFTDAGLFKTHIFKQHTIESGILLEPEDAAFIRAEVWRGTNAFAGSPILVSNPVFFE